MSRPTPDSAAQPQRPSMPLSLTRPGQEVELAAVEGGRQMTHRLAEMGLTPGVRFEVIRRGRPGPTIVSVKGVKLVLGQGMIHRIRVRPLDN